MVTIHGSEKMAITVNWGAISLVSVIAFVIGWFLFGLLAAIVLAIIVMVLMGIIKFGPENKSPASKKSTP
jgi:hypothetical protein